MDPSIKCGEKLSFSLVRHARFVGRRGEPPRRLNGSGPASSYDILLISNVNLKIYVTGDICS